MPYIASSNGIWLQQEDYDELSRIAVRFAVPRETAGAIVLRWSLEMLRKQDVDLVLGIEKKPE